MIIYDKQNKPRLQCSDECFWGCGFLIAATLTIIFVVYFVGVMDSDHKHEAEIERTKVVTLERVIAFQQQIIELEREDES